MVIDFDNKIFLKTFKMAQNYAVLADEFVKAYYDFYDNPAKRVGLEQLYHVRLSEYLSMVVFN